MLSDEREQGLTCLSGDTDMPLKLKSLLEKMIRSYYIIGTTCMLYDSLG